MPPGRARLAEERVIASEPSCHRHGPGERSLKSRPAQGECLSPSARWRRRAIPTSSMISFLIIYACVAIGFSFLCSVAEAVLLSVSPSYIGALEEKGRRSARRWKHLKANVDRPLAAILSLNTIAHTVGAAGVGAEAATIWGSEALGWASAVMTLLVLVLSEIIPKTIGAVYWRRLAGPTAQFLEWLIWLLYPLVLLSEILTRIIAGGNKTQIVTREEVAAMAAISAASGQLEASESRILANLFRLKSLKVQDIMTPRTVIVAFSQDTTVGEVLEQNPNLAVSRIPIYDGTIDHPTGFVLKTDILLAQANGKPETKLEEMRRDLRVVSCQASLAASFDALLNQRAHLALVVDQYGGADGLVTLEDLLETLLGAEIVDESDAATDMQRYARQRWEKRIKALGIEIDASEENKEPAPKEPAPKEPAPKEPAPKEPAPKEPAPKEPAPFPAPEQEEASAPDQDASRPSGSAGDDASNPPATDVPDPTRPEKP